LVVKVLVGEGRAIVQAVAQANLIQPRYTDRVRTNDRGMVDVEPVRRRRRPMWWGKQRSWAPYRSTGVLGMACTKRHATQIGDPLAVGQAAWTKQIRHAVVASGSDEAIVSHDPGGQHNPWVSQGPLDEGARGIHPARHAPRGHRDRFRGLGCRISRIFRRRSASTARLKPYWGKPAVRNFRGGRENTMTEVRWQTLNGHCIIQLRLMPCVPTLLDGEI